MNELNMLVNCATAYGYIIMGYAVWLEVASFVLNLHTARSNKPRKYVVPMKPRAYI